MHEDINQSGEFIQFLSLKRECQCTICCFNRPTLEVYYADNSDNENRYVGKIVNPCLLCNLGMELYDKDSILKYKLDGSCCQLGVCCQLIPCEACQEVDFSVEASDGQPLSTKAVKVIMIFYYFLFSMCNLLDVCWML